jgi:hypothetical protein
LRVRLDQCRHFDRAQVDPSVAQSDQTVATVCIEALPEGCVGEQFADYELHAALRHTPPSFRCFQELAHSCCPSGDLHALQSRALPVGGATSMIGR